MARVGRVRAGRRLVYPVVLAAGVLGLVNAEPWAQASSAAGGASRVSTGQARHASGAVPRPVRPAPGGRHRDQQPATSVQQAGFFWDAGIPSTVLAAYRHAAAVMKAERPDCRLDWSLLAGIGKVESDHAEGGDVAANGDVLHPILGPVLDGASGNGAVPNAVGTAWGQSGAWARAVGPMQFLPSTWRRWGGGGNPENVNDAALAAARYLCSGGGDLSSEPGLSDAIFSYNHSVQYVVLVEQWMRFYHSGGVAVPDRYDLGGLGGFTPPASAGQDDTVSAKPAKGGPSGRRPGSGPTASSSTSPTPSASPTPSPTRQPGPAPSPTQPVLNTVLKPVLGTVTKLTKATQPVLGGLLP